MGQVGIELPPVQADLFGLIYRTNQEPDAHGQQLNVGKRYANVSRDHKPLVEDAIQDVNQISVAGNSRYAFHPSGR